MSPLTGPVRVPTAPGRVRHAFAAAQASEYAAGITRAHCDDDAEPGEWTTTAVQLIIQAIAVRDAAVLAERERGTDWPTIARSLHCSVDAVLQQYEEPVTRWLASPDAPGAPSQPGAPGGMHMTAKFGPASIADACAWLTGWLRRQAVLNRFPLPECTEPAANVR